MRSLLHAARRPALRLLALTALGGQLAAIADALFVEHVTCAQHGDRIHVSARGPAPAAGKWDGVRPASGDAADQHDPCLLDEDGDQAPAGGAPATPAPVPTASSTPRFDLTPPVTRRAALYRLAPKNSPPEKSRPLV